MCSDFVESFRNSGKKGTDLAVNHDGTVVVAGGDMYGTDSEGQIGIFIRSRIGANIWNEQIIYRGMHERLGRSVDVSDISPGYVAAGAHMNHTVRIYRYNQATSLMEVDSEISDYPNQSFFGWSVAMSKTRKIRLVVSAYFSPYSDECCISFVRIYQ